jgi:hypothetical protein
LIFAMVDRRGEDKTLWLDFASFLLFYCYCSVLLSYRSVSYSYRSPWLSYLLSCHGIIWRCGLLYWILYWLSWYGGGTVFLILVLRGEGRKPRLDLAWLCLCLCFLCYGWRVWRRAKTSFWLVFALLDFCYLMAWCFVVPGYCIGCLGMVWWYCYRSLLWLYCFCLW